MRNLPIPRIAVVAMAVVVVVVTPLAAGCSRSSTGSASAVNGPAPPAAQDAESSPDATPAWRWDAPAPSSVGMPAGDQNGVVVSYGHHRLVNLSDEGELVWDIGIDRLRDVAPRLAGPLIVAPTEEALVAVRRRDGEQVWRAAVPDRANTPVVVDDNVVTTTWDGDVVAVGVDDGMPVWSARLPGTAIAPPSGSDGVVVASWDDGPVVGAGLVAYDAATGRERWSVPLPGGALGGTAVAGGAVVVVAGDLTVRAIDLLDGDELWRARTAGGAGSPEVPPLPLEDDAVLVADRLCGLVLFDGEGTAIWSTKGRGAAVRGGAAGPRADGRYALPVDEGLVQLAGPDAEVELLEPSGRVAGVALTGPDRRLVIATREAPVNSVFALGP